MRDLMSGQSDIFKTVTGDFEALIKVWSILSHLSHKLRTDDSFAYANAAKEVREEWEGEGASREAGRKWQGWKQDGDARKTMRIEDQDVDGGGGRGDRDTQVGGKDGDGGGGRGDRDT